MANLRYVHDSDCEAGDDVIQDVFLPVILWQPAQDGHCKVMRAFQH